MDVSHAEQPTLISIDRQTLFEYGRVAGKGEVLAISFTPFTAVPPRQRLEAALEVQHGSHGRLDGGVLAAMDQNDFYTYRLLRLRSASADFKQTGRYESTLLERAIGTNTYHTVAARGIVYLSQSTFGFPRVTAFDIRDPQHPRPVAHFAAPDDVAQIVCPLPDGRVLVGGRKLYLLGPPTARS